MKNVIIAAALILGSNNMFAQNTVTSQQSVSPAQTRIERTPENIAKMQTDRLNSQVTLTDEQSKNIYKANLNFATKMQGARQSKDMSGFRIAMQERDAEYQKILTTEQYKKYKQTTPARYGNPSDQNTLPVRTDGTAPVAPTK